MSNLSICCIFGSIVYLIGVGAVLLSGYFRSFSFLLVWPYLLYGLGPTWLFFIRDWDTGLNMDVYASGVDIAIISIYYLVFLMSVLIGWKVFRIDRAIRVSIATLRGKQARGVFFKNANVLIVVMVILLFLQIFLSYMFSRTFGFSVLTGQYTGFGDDSAVGNAYRTVGIGVYLLLSSLFVYFEFLRVSCRREINFISTPLIIFLISTALVLIQGTRLQPIGFLFSLGYLYFMNNVIRLRYAIFLGVAVISLLIGVGFMRDSRLKAADDANFTVGDFTLRILSPIIAESGFNAMTATGVAHQGVSVSDVNVLENFVTFSVNAPSVLVPNFLINGFSERRGGNEEGPFGNPIFQTYENDHQHVISPLGGRSIIATLVVLGGCCFLVIFFGAIVQFAPLILAKFLFRGDIFLILVMCISMLSISLWRDTYYVFLKQSVQCFVFLAFLTILIPSSKR